MIATTAAFQAAVQGSHTMAVEVAVRRRFDSNDIALLYPIDGSVSVDAGRATRRTASLTFADYDGTLLPSNLGSYLTPWGGYEIVIRRGVVYPSGTREMVALGVFTVISASAQADDSGVTISVNLEDRASLMSATTFASTYTIASGTNLTTAIANLINNRLTNSIIVSAPTSVYTTPKMALGNGDWSDPLEDLRRLATAQGWEIGFAADGTAVAAAHPQFGLAPVATIATGTAGTLLSSSRAYTVDGITNSVTITTGSTYNTADLYTATSRDSDPQSPTYYLNPAVGERNDQISNGVILSTAQAQEAADNIIRQFIGQPVSFEMIPNPALDVRDTVLVTDSRINLNHLVVIDSIEIPLTSDGTMAITGRTRYL